MEGAYLFGEICALRLSESFSGGSVGAPVGSGVLVNFGSGGEEGLVREGLFAGLQRTEGGDNRTNLLLFMCTLVSMRDAVAYPALTSWISSMSPFLMRAKSLLLTGDVMLVSNPGAGQGEGEGVRVSCLMNWIFSVSLSVGSGEARPS